MRFFGTHRQAHEDELMALALAYQEGRRKWYWPSVELPEIVLYDSDEDLLSRSADNEDIGYIGIAGKVRDQVKGLVFDEHLPDEGRIPNECACTLVAKELGVYKKKRYRQILDEVLRSDSRPGQMHLEMGQFIKTIYRYSPDNEVKRVFRFVRATFNAFRRLHSGRSALRELNPVRHSRIGIPDLNMGSRQSPRPRCRYIVVPAYAPFRELVKVYLLQEFGQTRWYMPGSVKVRFIRDEKHLARYVGIARKHNNIIFVGFQGGQFGPETTVRDVALHLGVKRRGKLQLIEREANRFETDPDSIRLFELPSIVDALNTHSHSKPHHVYARVRWVLDSIQRKAQEFFELCPDDFESNGFLGEKGGIKFAYVESDLLSMNAYCRTVKKAAVVLKVGVNTNKTNIFTDHKHKAAIIPIARQILIAEAERAGTKPDSLKRKLKRFDRIVKKNRGRELPGFHHWYFFVEAGQLHNGTTTHDAKPTKLSRQRLVKAVALGMAEYARSLQQVAA